MNFLRTAILAAMFNFCCNGFELPRSAPEAQGVSSAAVLSFVDTADKKIDSMHSFMLLRHGTVIAEGWWAPYSAQTPHVMWSLSKSFTSSAVGIAIGEGKLSLDDEVLKAFPDEAPAEPSKNLKLMRVRDLLRMSCGHQSEPPHGPEQSWSKSFLAHPVLSKPGTHFLYNSMGTYMLSAMVQKAVGMSVLEYLRPRLFEPLGIESPLWESSPQGVSCGGWGLHLRTEDIARFGQLYLQKGKWQERQLVPAGWVQAASTLQTSNGSNPQSDWDQGYGYQFWRCRHGAFRGDGAFGQYCVVMPEQDAVLVITSGVKNMQAPLDLVWEKLLPAMQAAPLPPDEVSAAKLAQRLKQLALPPQEGSATPAGLPLKTFVFTPNKSKLESLRLDAAEQTGAVTLLAKINGVEQRIVCGRGAWQKNNAAWSSLPAQPLAASGAWTADDTFTAKLCFNESTYMLTVTLKFSGGEVHCVTEWNATFGPSKEVELVSKTE